MRVIVSGSRENVSESYVFEILDKIHAGMEITFVIDGAARGVDTHAYRWRTAKGLDGVREKAEWDKYGKPAGNIRNQTMIDKHSPDVLISFSGGTGTQDMRNRAYKHEIPVIIVMDNGCIHDPHDLVS
jgi:hypothetical protein